MGLNSFKPFHEKICFSENPTQFRDVDDESVHVAVHDGQVHALLDYGLSDILNQHLASAVALHGR